MYIYIYIYIYTRIHSTESPEPGFWGGGIQFFPGKSASHEWNKNMLE